MALDVDQIAKLIKRELRHDADYVSAIDGFAGTGKTTLAVQLAIRLDPNFKLKRNIVFTKEEVKDRIEKLPKGSVIIFDEAMLSLYRRNWRDVSEFNEYMSTVRTFNKVVFMVAPNFWDLDKGVQGRCTSRIWIVKRSYALYFVPFKCYERRNVWLEDKIDTYKFFKSQRQKYNVEKIIQYSKTIPTCVGEVNFNRIDENDDFLNVYRKYKEQRISELAGTKKVKSKYEEKYRKELYEVYETLIKQGLTHIQLSKLLGLKTSVIAKRLNDWRIEYKRQQSNTSVDKRQQSNTSVDKRQQSNTSVDKRQHLNIGLDGISINNDPEGLEKVKIPL